MKLIIIVSLIACSYAAKLDRTYLPPPGAQTSGGSPGSLETPFGSTGPSGFGQSPNIGDNQAFKAQDQGGKQPTFAPNQGFGLGGNQFGAASQGASQPALDAPEGLNQNAGQENIAPEQRFGAESQPERPQAGLDRAAEILRYTNENDGENFAYSFETSNGISAEESGVATNGVQAQGAFAYTGDDGQMYSVTYTADENGYLPKGDHLPTPPPIPEEILRSLEKNAEAAAAGTQEGAYNPEEDVASPEQYNAQNGPQQPSGSSEQYGAPASPFIAPASNQGPQMNYNAGQTSNGAVSNRFAPSAINEPAQAQFAPSAPTSASGFISSASSGPAPTRFAPSGPAQSSPALSGFAPSAPSGFVPSRPVQAAPARFAPTSAPQQYNRPSPSFRQQNNIPVQAQDESGYRYNQPQNSGSQGFRTASPKAFGASPSNNGATQSFVRPAGNSQVQSARPVAPAFNNVRPTQYSAGGNFQRPSAPLSVPQYNAANNGFQASRTTPVSNNLQASQFNARSNVQRPYQYNAAADLQSSRPSQAAPRMPEYQSAPYQYNPPKSQNEQITQNGNQGSGPFNPLATQTFNQGGQNQGSQNLRPQNQGPRNQGPQTQGTQNQRFQNQVPQNQIRPTGQDFSGPLQQPSFSPEEGYKY